MKGVVFTEAGAQPEIVDDLEKPSPGPDQVLVKSVWTAINPVDTFLSSTGVLVVEWPFVLGVDAGGIVVEAGEEASSKYGLVPGAEVFGCTRLGHLRYSTVQEYYLMDAKVTFPKPKNITLAQACTMGVGVETACLGVFDSLQVPLPDPKQQPEEKEEWFVVLGGASSVGKCAIQLAKAAGYKVVASCSAKSADVVKDIGGVPFDYKKPMEQQVKDVLDITSGNFSKVFDVMATDDPILAKELFKVTKSAVKDFATTNDWSNIGDFEGGTTHEILLGPVGRPDAQELNENIASYIPLVVGLIETGKLKPAEYEAIGDGGFESAVKAFEYQRSGAGGARKVIVKIQDP